VEQLLRMPEMGAPRIIKNPVLEGLRFWPVGGFEDFLIFYIVCGEENGGVSIRCVGFGDSAA
jgi:hypothetical protein